ncbi:SIS domain-containing protein [Caldanaerobacter subterraneus]|uniref:SIS domain-containing protein n=1 Tax=Caldanaerobacter subterraneus TaxID=911092 RepID=UPI003463E6B2
MLDLYIEEIYKRIEKIKSTQLEKIKQAAHLITESLISEDSVFHVFGCGHSHMAAEELFYRAGGLACVNAILPSELMLHEGALKSSYYERNEEIIKLIFDRYELRKGECIIIVSHSGRNGAPVEAAIDAKRRGLHVVALTSTEYKQKTFSRHSSGKFLEDVADIVIDNCGPYGDAVLTVEKEDIKISFSPLSTVLNTVILNMLEAEIITNMLEKNMSPPVFLSGNIEGAEEYNLKLIEKYRKRLRHL